MKTFTLQCVFLLLFVCTGFKMKDTHAIKGALFATLDGQSFDWDYNKPYRGLMIDKQAFMNGRGAPVTVINLNFNGPSYYTAQGKRFNEAIEFFIACPGERPVDTPGFTAQLLYASANYFAVNELSKLRVTGFHWLKERNMFSLSADFDIVMRSYGYPMDNIADVRMKGSFEDVTIMVPEWIIARLQATN